jgi:hypothetical protein
MPTVDPNGITTEIVTDANGDTGVLSQCRKSVPADATMVVDQQVFFEYSMNLVPGTDVFLAIDSIAARLQGDLTNEYLDCRFPPGQNFYTQAMSSLPVDILSTQTCSAANTASDCYIVDAVYTAKLFYLPSARELQSSTTITDPNVLDSFSASLQALFESGNLTSGMSSILSTTFQNITNQDNGSSSNTTNDDATPPPTDDMIAPPIVNGSNSNKSLSSGAVAGSVIGTLIGVALIAALIAFAVTRRHRPGGEKAVDVTHMEFNDLDQNDSSERDDRAMLADRSLLASDDGSFTSGYGDRSFEVDVVYDDEQQSIDTGFLMSAQAAVEKPKVIGQDPSFVKTNDILDQLQQAEMRSKMIEAEMGASMARSPSRGQRGYGIKDTVDL